MQNKTQNKKHSYEKYFTMKVNDTTKNKRNLNQTNYNISLQKQQI